MTILFVLLQILLQDFQPKNINHIPQTQVDQPMFDIIDMHSHDYTANSKEVDEWVRVMDSCHIRHAVLHHCNWIGEDFGTMVKKYAKYPDRFSIWCCIDYSHWGQADFADHAIKQLELNREMGAKGVGELVDKGLGDVYARPVEGKDIHIDDPALDPVLEYCGKVGLPINIHIAEPYWMYLPSDKYNDGLVNAGTWHVDTSMPGCFDYDKLMMCFENAVRKHPNTIFIAAHYLNMNHDLPRLGALLERYPNLYIDISGRFGEAAQTPRATRAFMIRYQDRIFYGTDNVGTGDMYRTTFRILETEDEHFYIPDFGYHWYYSAFALPKEVLDKIYHLNAEKLFNL